MPHMAPSAYLNYDRSSHTEYLAACQAGAQNYRASSGQKFVEGINLYMSFKLHIFNLLAPEFSFKF
jgi:hypothetical protein